MSTALTFEEMVATVALRPGMWVGTCRLRDVAIFLDGFARGLESATGNNPLRGWSTWIETKYLVSHPAWHWTAILRHVHGSDATALAALPELITTFQSETRGFSLDTLEARHRESFLNAFGAPYHSPGDPPPE